MIVRNKEWISAEAIVGLDKIHSSCSFDSKRSRVYFVFLAHELQEFFDAAVKNSTMTGVEIPEGIYLYFTPGSLTHVVVPGHPGGLAILTLLITAR